MRNRLTQSEVMFLSGLGAALAGLAAGSVFGWCLFVAGIQ